MVNGVHGVNGVTSGTAQRRADTGWGIGTATESVTTRNRKTTGKNVQAHSKMKSSKDVIYKSVQVRKFKSWKLLKNTNFWQKKVHLTLYKLFLIAEMRTKVTSKTSKILSDVNSTKNETSPVITGNTVNHRNKTIE